MMLGGFCDNPTIYSARITSGSDELIVASERCTGPHRHTRRARRIWWRKGLRNATETKIILRNWPARRLPLRLPSIRLAPGTQRRRMGLFRRSLPGRLASNGRSRSSPAGIGLFDPGGIPAEERAFLLRLDLAAVRCC